MRMMLRLVHDNTILALDSETPLLIRSLIIHHATILRLCVSCPNERKGDTLCLPQMYPNLLLCCLETPAQPPHLVF